MIPNPDQPERALKRGQRPDLRKHNQPFANMQVREDEQQQVGQSGAHHRNARNAMSKGSGQPGKNLRQRAGLAGRARIDLSHVTPTQLDAGTWYELSIKFQLDESIDIPDSEELLTGIGRLLSQHTSVNLDDLAIRPKGTQ